MRARSCPVVWHSYPPARATQTIQHPVELSIRVGGAPHEGGGRPFVRRDLAHHVRAGEVVAALDCFTADRRGCSGHMGRCAR